MLYPLSSHLNHPFESRSRCESSALFFVLLMLAGTFARAAEPTEKLRTDAKESLASFRVYLPTIRLKSLRDNERQSVADLEKWLKYYDVWLEGGVVNLLQRGQIEEQYHRSRVRALRIDTDYRDSVDQFTSRFRVSEERRRQMEDAAIVPLTKVFQRFEELSRDSEAALAKLNQTGDSKDVAQVRPELVKILTESALVENTNFPKRFLKHWRDSEKIDDTHQIMQKVLKEREDLHRLRMREVQLIAKQQKLAEAERQRMADLKFELDTDEFQHGLLLYEKQPWKDKDDGLQRLRHQREAFFDLVRIFLTLLGHARIERLERLEQSWPGLAPVRIADLDLLSCKLDKAEETVTSLLKTPDAQRAGRKKIRRVRALADSYRIQQRIFQLTCLRREAIKNKIASPPDIHSDPALGVPLLGIGQRESFGAPTLPEAIRESCEVRTQLLQTWIDYQIVRIDLFDDLGLSPPDR